MAKEGEKDVAGSMALPVDLQVQELGLVLRS